MRLEFKAKTKNEAYDRSGGICECHRVPMLHRPEGCGRGLGIGNQFYEHITPAKNKDDNSLSNCAVLSKTCWREKTAIYDLKVIAKTKRQRNLARGIK